MSENSTGAAAVVGESGAANVSTKQAKLWAFLMAFDRYRKTPRLSIESVSVAFDAYMGAPDDPPPAAPSDSFRAALNEFMEKLDWAFQKRDWPFGALDMHIADVITRYVRCLESDAKRDAKRYCQAIESYSHTIKLLREKLAAETKCVEAHYSPPFIFDGTLGMYRVRYESGHTGEVEVIRSSSGLEFIDSDRDRRTLNADGTFDGGKLTKFLRPLEG